MLVAAQVQVTGQVKTEGKEQARSTELPWLRGRLGRFCGVEEGRSKLAQQPPTHEKAVRVRGAPKSYWDKDYEDSIPESRRVMIR